jgi:hypothetical protein
MQQYMRAVVTLYVMGMVGGLIGGALFKLFTSVSLF